jgi:hypothetical protein
MHKIVRLTASGAAGLALAVGGVAVTAGPAAADTPGCVTKKEYRHIHKGMTKKRVHRIFDTHRNWGTGGGAVYTRTYQSCDFHHAAWIRYKRIPNKPDRTTGWKDWTGAS